MSGEVKKIFLLGIQVLIIFALLDYFKVDEYLWGSSGIWKSQQTGETSVRSSRTSRSDRWKHDRSASSRQTKGDSEPVVAPKSLKDHPKSLKDEPVVPRSQTGSSSTQYDVTCNMQLVETVPYTLKTKGYAPAMEVEHMSTQHAWFRLIEMAKHDFAIVSQWGIGKKGKGADFYNYLAESVLKKDLQLRIVHTYKFKKSSNHTPSDMRALAPNNVQSRLPNIAGKTLPGFSGGIIHSKIMVADRDHFYLGSANVGSRGTSWTKEMGMMVSNCPPLGHDARKLFDLYWGLQGVKVLPDRYPKELGTKINADAPLRVLNKEDDTIYNVYLGSSPPVLCADGRTDDLTAIVQAIDKADKFIYIAINEYIPMDLWKNKKPWTIIDDRLRAAVSKRKVEIKFLFNSKASHKKWMESHLRDIMQLNGKKEYIQAKFYSTNIKGFQGSHNKIMVTDKSAYIGTSNWTEDYFTTTAGVAIVYEPIGRRGTGSSRPDMREQMVQVFMRDFNSPIATVFDPNATEKPPQSSNEDTAKQPQ